VLGGSINGRWLADPTPDWGAWPTASSIANKPLDPNAVKSKTRRNQALDPARLERECLLKAGSEKELG
jgi:hypothetical protein